MIQAVLFDLDGTLLDIDLEDFLRSYFALLGPTIARLMPNAEDTALPLQAVIAGTEAMSSAHPDRTNRDVFNERFEALTGVNLADEEPERTISDFYATSFPALRGGHGPAKGGRKAVSAARAIGLQVALATNPIFPRPAIEERLLWAGFGADEFDLITSYETMYACKPRPEYFRQIATSLGVDASACLMVGDDPMLDLAASDVGMKTYFVGDALSTSADWRGSLDELAVLLPHLASEA